MEVPVFGSQVLEVAVGLVFVYLLLSIACSGIKEVIAGLFGLRSKTLKEGICNMLNDPKNDFATPLFAHPLIARTARPGDRPSYISSRNFALALRDVIAPASGTQPRALQDLRTSVANLPDSALRKTILGLLDSAQGDLEAARKNVEKWYDNTMDRVSGWYKREAQLIIFVAGLLLCVFLNADTLMILKELWNDRALSSAIVAQAEAKGKALNQTQNQTLTSAGGQVNVPASPKEGSERSSVQQVEKEIRDASAPPIGWTGSSGDVRGFPDGVTGWLKKVVGIFISAIAVAMGAPFWFDLLNKIVNLRLSGDLPPDSRQASGS
jgi:hypothetical protein